MSGGHLFYLSGCPYPTSIVYGQSITCGPREIPLNSLIGELWDIIEFKTV